ncbi:restriction endonuclease subunit S [Natronogracilivirga saccharolytica]|uniref:Restriction endonuclease subunit S n=1 Tax=Natronogracilivirga saccharolytica TaxID=2812953 RepID=A0A8J7S894_9BACT|nr:restriction endonuclease subunit S [Natronogracilivirga saccharolytica]MBP3193783.1 restriction endonuclease subunit S [Natronogracilivirga saccharolytica]
MNKVDPDILQEVEQTLDVAGIKRFEPYPSYKPTSVDWLGDVPDHWEVIQSRRFFKILNGSTPSSSESSYWDGDIVWVTPDDLSKNSDSDIRDSRRRISQSGYNSCGATIAPPNSIVVSTRAPIGYVAIAGVSLCCNQGCRILAPNKTLDSKFFYYQLLSAGSELSSRGRGTTFTELSYGQLASVELLSPPLDEQQVIARFLDDQTRKIDDLIEAKQKLLDLLKEKRQAIITHAVTKGINPDVQLKPSGIEWLGDVPEHWEMKKLKYTCDFSGGFTPNTKVVDYWDGDIPWVSPKDMKHRYISETEDYVTELAVNEVFRRIVAPKSVLIVVRSGILIHSLPVAINKTGVTINQDMRALMPKKMLDSEYLALLIHGNQSALLHVLTKPGTTVQSIESQYLLNEPIPVPPIDEQLDIVNYINNKIHKIDLLTTETNKAIERLTEYRIALISAAVTGKIDVRGRA